MNLLSVDILNIAAQVLTSGDGVSIAAMFSAGLLAFFSPCVLPIIPLYMAYLSGGTQKVEADGTITFDRKKTLINTLFFILGISTVYVVLAFVATSLGKFIGQHGGTITKVAGVLIVVLGIVQLVISLKGGQMGTERRVNFNWSKYGMNPIVAFLLGFFFSFAWTPCVGPMLVAAITMAANAATQAKGFLYMMVYSLGFTIPFLLLGIFTTSVLNLFKKHQKVMKYTVTAGAVLMIVMGALMFFGIFGTM